MTCTRPKPIYANPPFRGLKAVASKGDGYSIDLEWHKAIADRPNNDVAYNIYYSTQKELVFEEGVKFVVIDPDQTTATLTGFSPGDVLYFAVRATLHDSNLNELSLLPSTPDGCKIYPEGILLKTISDGYLQIPVSDVDQFPSFGVVQIGVELIAYSAVDIPDGYLIVSSVANRGIFNTEARIHQPDGYDGVTNHENPLVRYFKGFEEDNTNIILEENKFDHPNFARTDADGYRTQNDVLTSQEDLVAAEAEQGDFRAFDFAGFRRTDPVRMLRGDCVGSYYGGEHFCSDGYGGIAQRVRGLGIEEFNSQRLEVLLSTTGRFAVLVQRQWEGITCSCFISSRETPEPRCPRCYGTGLQPGYQQFFNSRRSDGRILVRFDPTVEDLEPRESGLESTFSPNAWTLPFPIIKDRDFLVTFNEDGTETWRYEILTVTRNQILLENIGAQKMTLNRVRKTDPIYQFPIFGNTATMPTELTTTIGMVPGPGGIPPHVHTLVINEGIVSLTQINQQTGISQGHSHRIINGEVQEDGMGHTHEIIL